VAPSLPERVLAYVRRLKLLRPGDRLGVAVSGGADSVALLHLLRQLSGELGLVLSVVHFHHQIRGAEADADQQFVRALAERLGLPFSTESGNVPAHARTAGLSLETAARELRYAWFRKLCGTATVGKIATAHTLDDQAETVLMRLLRGAGTRGFSGIYPAVLLPEASSAAGGAAIVRPLLELQRSELEEYLHALGQEWREDSTNRDVKHTRNRVRHVLLPLLEREFNPAIRQVLAETAEIARAEESYWRDTVESHLADVVHVVAPAGGAAQEGNPAAGEVHLRVDKLAELPLAVQRRIVRQAIAGAAPDPSAPPETSLQHAEQVLKLIPASGAAEAELRGPWRVRRVPGCPESANPRQDFRTGAELIIEQTRARRAPASRSRAQRKNRPSAPAGYEYVLPVPGELHIRELGLVLRASVIDPGAAPEQGYNLADLLNPQTVGSELRVRNWRAGDRFWPAHTKAPRKLKELLQSRHVSGMERVLWPVAANSAGELVWLRGFGVPERFAASPHDRQALVVQEVRTIK